MYWLLLVALLFCANCVAWNPVYTKGHVWPLPQYISYLETVNLISSEFQFKITNETCDILVEAVKRYSNIVKHIFHDDVSTGKCKDVYEVDGIGKQSLRVMEVRLTSPCEEWPHLYMDEHYELHVNSPDYKGTGVITSSSVWGMLRGLETFSQLVTPLPDFGCLVVNSTDILDYPRLPHRGLLLDTSRHYLPVSIIINILSAMEMNKMNVFHWHIVDDQSFPYQSYSFPSLSEKGAYDPKRFVYTQENVRSILDYGKYRGIRVVPEFDSPGHTLSWGKGVSKLLTPCYTGTTLSGKSGPIDPSRYQNYKFLKTLLEEVKNVFPDKYIHIGGDEVDYTCWESNPNITKFMKEKNITDYQGLEAYYIKAVLEIMHGVNASGIVWQEVFQHNAHLHNDTVVHIWTGDRRQLLNEVTAQGKFALLSEGWYLDHISDQWEDFYAVDPTDFGGSAAQVLLVLGGEACMWGEMVDESNIVPRVWPRASAVAERLWSSKQTADADAAQARLNEHVCRMKRRGIAAQPANGPGFCSY